MSWCCVIQFYLLIGWLVSWLVGLVGITCYNNPYFKNKVCIM